MFRFIRTIITNIMNLRAKHGGCENASDVALVTDTIETIDIDTIEMKVPALVPIALVPALVHAIMPIALVPARVPSSVDDFTYQCEGTVIHKWKTAAKDDPVPLIAMIRQLYFSRVQKNHDQNIHNMQ